MDPLVAAAFVLALAVAIRSTWSPCGLSMLSTVTPLAERGRDHSYAVTAAWFIVGGVLGGATLGVAAAALAMCVAAIGPTGTAVAGAVALASAVAVASDVRWFGFGLPAHTRQVDEAWLAKYRAWVYGIGFGWQIGVGLATYIMTAGVYLLIVVAALTGSPAGAFAIALAFGTARGLAVLLGARITSPEQLFAFHRRFDSAGPPARLLVIAVEAALMVCGAVWAWGAVGAASAAAVIAIGAVARVRLRSGASTAAA